MPEPTRDPEPQGDDDSGGTPRWAKVFWIGILALVVLFVILHLAGGGMGGHHH